MGFGARRLFSIESPPVRRQDGPSGIDRAGQTDRAGLGGSGDGAR